MSTNCIKCVKRERTGADLLCDECRAITWGTRDIHCAPKGIRFFDCASNREMILVGPHEPRAWLRGWVVYKHPDGQWVTLRKATDDDIRRVTAASVTP